MIDAFATIEDLSVALGRGGLSSVELTNALLDRIASLDPVLHAFSEVHADQARASAAGADERRRGGDQGPLLGIPIAVKDIFDIAGRPTSAGSLALDDRRPARSASVVSRLEAAGMVVLGRTHMVEFAYGGWGTNPVRGAPRNPWDAMIPRVAGGSSSGSAVAVAAGLTPAALGTDTGGSVRTPAAWCGIVGMKTSLGLVSRAGAVPLAPTHDSVGPMTRSVRDTALLLEGMVGADAEDNSTLDVPPVRVLEGIEDGVDGLTIGVLPERDLAAVEAPLRDAYVTAVSDLEKLGVVFREIQLPLTIAEYLGNGGDIMSVESYALLGVYVERHSDLVDPTIAARILRGRSIRGPDYFRLLQSRIAAQVAFRSAAQGFDAFLMPGSHILPIALDEVDESKPPNHFGRLVNYLDLASLVVPIGVTSSGLPAGLQIVVRKFDDARALRIGRALERHRGGLFIPPPAYASRP